ncbi:Fic protein family phage protein [Streptococcus pyogenes]|uniref:Fic family protein n=1 Tax=Streptococcus pyogenes TaxID=1314 RepID=UPI00109CDB1E|nr:Fic family protein [Streptococcus pyogenes]VHM06631.1 Fic protein family phage protein [Streptococcus pyogenes]
MYQTLEKLSYKNYLDSEKEYVNRLESPSTTKLNLTIHPFSFKKQCREREEYPLFYMNLTSHAKLLEQIQQNSIRLREFKLPQVAQDKLFLTQVINEIQSTNDIEGVQSTRREIKEAYESPKSNKRFSGIVKMYFGIKHFKVEKIESLSDFRYIYDNIFLDEMSEKDRPDGKLFRKGLAFVGKGDKNVHQGDVSEELINADLTKLIVFMNSDQVPLIIKAIITHYFFEYIHPFYDGNGRMGRFLLSSYLSRKLDLFTGLSISNSIYQNRVKYDKAFAGVSNPKNKADLTLFIQDILEIIINGQNLMIETSEMMKDKLKVIASIIDTLNITKLQEDLLYILSQNRLFDLFNERITNKDFVKILDNKYSRTKINNALIELEQRNLVKKVSKNPVAYDLVNEFID